MALATFPATLRGGTAWTTVAAAVVAAEAFVTAALGGSGLALYQATGTLLGREALATLLAVPSSSMLVLLYVVIVPASLVALAASLWRRAVGLRWSAALLVVAALLHLFGSAGLVGALALPFLPLLAVKGSPTAP